MESVRPDSARTDPDAPPRAASPDEGRPAARPEQVVRITAATGWQPFSVGELWAHRELAYFLVSRQFKSDFRNMALGPLWLVIRPILSVVIYTIVFSNLAKLPSDGLPYPLFSFSAVMLWTYFTSSVQTAANSLVANQHLLGKVYFPRLIVPIVGTINGLIPLAVSFVVLLIAAVCWGYPPRWTTVLVPIWVLVAGLAALAVGLWTAPWVVRFRDVLQALDYVLLSWMYVTPVVYAADLVPERWRLLYLFNPMTEAVQGLRWALFGVGDAPGARLGLVLLALVLLAWGGAVAFGRAERTFVDEV